MNLFNPNTPVAELPRLSDKLKRRLHGDGIRTVGRLEQCTAEQLRAFGCGTETLHRIYEALRDHSKDLTDLSEILASEGITLKILTALHPFDLLALPLTTAQLGYLIRWQHDIGGRYGDKEIFCVANGRVYYCTECPYRDERSNYCGWCTKKLLDELAEKKRGTP